MGSNINILETAITKLMRMDDSTWERHANPYSVWTRLLSSLPLLLYSIWSVNTFGAWGGLVVLVVCVWIWLNPRLFAAPKSVDNWASHVTFGEKIWLQRNNHPIPKHHLVWGNTLSYVTGVSFLVAAVMAYQHQLMLTAYFATVSWVGKMWFCDRMVWLYNEIEGSET